MDRIEIRAASRHNLKNLDFQLPKECLLVLTGVSGSGKSSLAFDTLFRAGQYRYLSLLSPGLRRRLLSRGDDAGTRISRLPPTMAVGQDDPGYSGRTRVASASGVAVFLHSLFALLAVPFCPGCRREMIRLGRDEIRRAASERAVSDLLEIHFPLKRPGTETGSSFADKLLRRGFLKARAAERSFYLENPPPEADSEDSWLVQVDVLAAGPENEPRWLESLSIALNEADGSLIILDRDLELFFSLHWHCPDCRTLIKAPVGADFRPGLRSNSCAHCRGLGRNDTGDACLSCQGSGLNENSLAFRWLGFSIQELQQLPVSRLLALLSAVDRPAAREREFERLLSPVLFSLQTMEKLHLGYIELNRFMNTLSPGESRRVRLAGQLGRRLRGILFILDEPTIGLHAVERSALLEVVRGLVRAGNTVLVVEHDPAVIRAADHVLELGPGAGGQGGRIVYNGSAGFFPYSGTRTAEYLIPGKAAVEPLSGQRRPPAWFSFSGLNCRNIRGLELSLPAGLLTVICGPSGSGKSTLLFAGLLPEFRLIRERSRSMINNRETDPLNEEHYCRSLQVLENSRACFAESSIPITFLGLAVHFRKLFASVPAARARGLPAWWFDHRRSGGRCRVCRGRGFQRLDLGLGPAMESACPICRGLRFSGEALSFKYRGLNFADLLALTVSEALEIFSAFPEIENPLQTLVRVELDYLTLGQRLDTLSGGEKQRIRLARRILRPAPGPTVHLVDEPTVGLHRSEVQVLLNIFAELLAKGDTVVVCEHDPEFIRRADYLVEMGPGAGEQGGRIVYQGDVPGLLALGSTLTGRAMLQEIEPCH